MPRVGLDELQAIVVDDSDGIAADLDARMQAAVDAYRDPWQEGASRDARASSAPRCRCSRCRWCRSAAAPDGSLQASSAGRGPAASGPFAGGAGTVSDYSERAGAQA